MPAPNFIAYATTAPEIDIISLALNMMFFAYAVLLMFRSVFRNNKISLNLIIGAICIYLLIGITCGMVYALLDRLIPNSFVFLNTTHVVSQMDALMQNFIYYSFATLTTLGYGDITPLSSPAKYFSVLEAVAGQIYLTVLVARLVGMHIAQK